MPTKKYTTWKQVPKSKLVQAVNKVVDPPYGHHATQKSSRSRMTETLKHHGITLKDMRGLK